MASTTGTDAKREARKASTASTASTAGKDDSAANRFRSMGRMAMTISGLESMTGIGVEKPALIIEFGAAYTKCGFAGEESPRRIIPSVTSVNGVETKVLAYEDQRSDVELREVLVNFIHDIVYLQLLVKTQDRRIVVSESMIIPSRFRQVLADVLFRHFSFMSVLFAPTPLFALFPLGTETALVVDCGYNETTILAVYNGIPLIGSFTAIPAGAATIHRHIEEKLKEMGAVGADESLDESVLEDIKVRACFVGSSPLDAEQITGQSLEYTLPSGELVTLDHAMRTGPCDLLFNGIGVDEDSIPTAICETLLRCPCDTRKELAQSIMICGGTAMLPGFTTRLASELLRNVETDEYKPLKGRETQRTQLTVELSATGGVVVDSLIIASDKNRLLDELDRKLVDCQVLSSEVTVDSNIVTCILTTPDDPSEELLQGVVPLSQRSYNIDRVTKDTSPHSSGVGDVISFFKFPFHRNFVTWLGAAMFGALECLSDRSLAKDAYLKSPVLPDWSSPASQPTPAVKPDAKPQPAPKAPTIVGRQRTPHDRPRAWGLGSLDATISTPSLVPSA